MKAAHMAATQDEPRQPKPRRALGMLLIFFCVPMGMIVILVSRTAASHSGAIGGGIVGAFGGLLVFLIQWGFRRGKKMRAPAAATILATDTRPPVLYLRSFAVDGSMLTGQQFMLRSYEEHLASALKRMARSSRSDHRRRMR
jgi:hypothetical protein